ncbi:MAG: VWA domain-containing protein [Acidobacteria bacterium]|nr:MAG: VWA domain-containing protein [Acidobacteriota bacterium]
MKKSRQCFLRLFLSLVLLISSIPGVNQGVNSFAQQDQKKEPEVQQGGPQKEETDTTVRPKKETPPKKRRLNPKKPSGDKPEDNFTLSVEIELINLDVAVTDKKGNFIPNLGQKNFRVYEDKVEQKISNFSPTTAPLTVVLLLEFGRTFAYWYDDVVIPAAHFVELLRPEDWAAVVAYDMKPEILTDFTQDKRELYGALSRLRIPGFSETNLFDALKDTLDRLEEVDGKKAVLLISTGIDTFSRITFDTILKRVQNTNAVIYCIGMAQLAQELFDARGWISPEGRLTFLQAENQLNTFARRTGGKAWFPRFMGEYTGILQQVGVELRNQYSIGYIPSNPAKDGKFRKVKVDVVDENGSPVKSVVVRAKEGYQAAKG